MFVKNKKCMENMGEKDNEVELHSIFFCREESQRVVDVILSRREDFGVFDTYISEYERSMSLLEESCRNNPAFASIVTKFEVSLLDETRTHSTRAVF